MKNSNFFCKIISELRAFVPGLFPGYCAQKIFSGIYRTLTGHQIKNILSYVLFIFDALQLSFYVYWAKMILNGCLPFTLFLRPVLARRAIISRPDWPKGPVQQDKTGPKSHYFNTKLARRASKSGPNWPEGPVHKGKTGPKGQ